MHRIRVAARSISTFFSGVVGYGVFLALAFLGVLGTFLTATDLLSVDVDPGVFLYPAALIVAANVIYREIQQRREAEAARDSVTAALGAKPDEAAILRIFIRLHDQGQRVLEPFDAVLEDLNTTMPEGESLYRDWIRLCTEAIEAYRPSYALRFRKTLLLAEVRRSPMIVGYDDGSDRTTWVDLERKRRHEDLVRQSMDVLAEIIAAG